MATRVKTEAATDIPCTKPLILHTVFEKGQPDRNIKECENVTRKYRVDSGSQEYFSAYIDGQFVVLRNVRRQKVEARAHLASRR